METEGRHVGVTNDTIVEGRAKESIFYSNMNSANHVFFYLLGLFLMFFVCNHFLLMLFSSVIELCQTTQEYSIMDLMTSVMLIISSTGRLTPTSLSKIIIILKIFFTKPLNSMWSVFLNVFQKNSLMLNANLSAKLVLFGVSTMDRLMDLHDT